MDICDKTKDGVTDEEVNEDRIDYLQKQSITFECSDTKYQPKGQKFIKRI